MDKSTKSGDATSSENSSEKADTTSISSLPSTKGDSDKTSSFSTVTENAGFLDAFVRSDASINENVVRKPRRESNFRQSLRYQWSRAGRFAHRHQVTVVRRRSNFTSNKQLETMRRGRDYQAKRLIDKDGLDVDARLKTSQETGLMLAVANGNQSVANYLLEVRADVRAADNTGKTVLMHAAGGSDPATLKGILSRGAKAIINRKCNAGKTALMYAAGSGKTDNVELLLRKGAGLETIDDRRWTAVVFAAYGGHKELVRYLVQVRSADVNGSNARAGGPTALMLACRGGHVGLVEALLQMQDVKPLAVDQSGMTAVMHAACGGSVGALSLVLTNTTMLTEVDADGMTPLMHAAKEGQAEAVAWLISKGAAVGDVDKSRRSALIHASANGRVECGRILLGNKANADGSDVDGLTAFLHSSAAGHVDMMKMLIGVSEKAATCLDDERSNENRSALMLASLGGHCNAVRWLLDKGAAVTAVDQSGMSALMLAACHGQTTVMELLLASDSVDISLSDQSGMTALMHACSASSFGKICHIELLIKHGCNVDATDFKGKTALMHAISYNNVAAAEILINRGANVAACDNDRKSALMYAAETGNCGAISMLLESSVHDGTVNNGDRHRATALVYAARCKDGVKAVKLLIERGHADKELSDADGMTPLMHAAALGYLPAVKALTKCGALVKSKDNLARTAFQHANSKNHWAISIYLAPKIILASSK